MEDLHFKATKTHPEVIFSEVGDLKIFGRMINDDLIDLFRPLFYWAEKTNVNKITIDIDLEYINTNGIFLMVKLLKVFEANQLVKHIKITWQFDEDDEEHYDIGCLIKQSLKRSEFNFLSKFSPDNYSDENYLLSLKAKR